jgi:hypothetical protein
MVKLAQTVGASSIAQGTRMTTNLSSAVVEVRQGTWDDMSEKHMFRVTPFTDIQYSGPEVAAMNSVIASCLVPTVCGVTRDTTTGYVTGKDFSELFTFNGDAVASFAAGDVVQIAGGKTDGKSGFEKNQVAYETLTGTGLADYLLGYGAGASAGSFEGSQATRPSTHSAFSEARKKLITTALNDESANSGIASALRRDQGTGFNSGDDAELSNHQRIAGTYPIRVEQFPSDEIAYDIIANNPQSLTLGYTMDSRAVNMVFTQSAISMIVRRLHRAVERYGPYKPVYTHVGLGHATENTGKDGVIDNYSVSRPGMLWNAGAIAYANKRLNAQGSLYIPQDQVPYSMMKRGFKYNHILTLLGLELIETLNAVGADMSSVVGRSAGGEVNRRSTMSGSAQEQIAMLQILFASVFGSVRGATNAADFEVDPTSVADSVKESIGMLFNSGHIHLDPGFLTYLPGAWNGSTLNDTTINSNLKYKGRSLTPAQMMSEFVAKYVTFVTAVTAFKPYFQVPLYDCHWLYVGSPKPEYVIEQLQMNYRPDVIFEGGASMPEYTLIPTQLNPGEVLERLPTLFNAREKVPNTYLGIRDPLPYGSVSEIRFHGDRPMTTIEEREYDFTPIIEADSSVNQVMRNGRVLNIAVLPRPAMYIPGVSILGAISGMMSDNASVGGSYYFQQHNGPFFNDTAKGGKSRPLRQVGMPLAKGNRQWAQRQLAGSASNSKGAVAMQAAIERTGISPDRNPQDPRVDQNDAPPVFTGGPALSHLGQSTNEVGTNE